MKTRTFCFTNQKNSYSGSANFNVDLRSLYRPNMLLKSFYGKATFNDLVGSLNYDISAIAYVTNGLFLSNGLTSVNTFQVSTNFPLILNGNITEFDSQDIQVSSVLSIAMVTDVPFQFQTATPTLPVSYILTWDYVFTFSFNDS